MSGHAAPAPHVVEDYRGVIQLLSDGTVVRSDAGAGAGALLPPEDFPDVPGVQWKDLVYDATHGLKLRVYRPPTAGDAERLPVLVCFHGGGYCLGTFEKPSFHCCCQRLASELRAVVLSADYRLAPEHRLPAAVDDAAGFLHWLRERAVDGDGDGDGWWLAEAADFGRVFVTGDSAGGTIAHHLAVRAGSAAAAAPADPVAIRGYVLLMPFFGGVSRTPSEAGCPAEVFLNLDLFDRFWRLSLPPGATRDHPMANPFGPDSPAMDGVELPPVLVVAGGLDMLRDRAVDYAERLSAMGKPVELAEFAGEHHGFFTLGPGSDAAGELIAADRKSVV